MFLLTAYLYLSTIQAGTASHKKKAPCTQADQSSVQEAVPTHHRGGRYRYYIGFLPEKQGGKHGKRLYHSAFPYPL